MPTSVPVGVSLRGSSAAIVTDGESLGTDGADCAKASRRGQVLEKNAVSWVVVLINPKVGRSNPMATLSTDWNARHNVVFRLGDMKARSSKQIWHWRGFYSRIPRDSIVVRPRDLRP